MAYPPITALPPAPSRSNPDTFADLSDAFVSALAGFQGETNTAGTYIDGKTAETETNANSASASAVTAGAEAATATAAASAAEAASNSALWVSGTTYTSGDNVYSPTTFFTYRAKSGLVSTVDPASDSTNWALIGVGGTALISTTNTTATQGQTAFTGTYAAGAVVVTLNGVILTIVVDYTATDGSTVNLVTGANAGDDVGIIGFPTFAIANTLPLTGGFLTGSLGGTNAAFSGAVTGNTLGATSITVSSATITGELIATSYNEKFVSLAAAATVDIDCETGNVFALTTGQGTTFTFSNPPATGTAYGFMLRLTAGATHTITYPTSVAFANSTAPDAPPSGNTDVLVFTTTDGGTTWYGALAINDAG